MMDNSVLLVQDARRNRDMIFSHYNEELVHKSLGELRNNHIKIQTILRSSDSQDLPQEVANQLTLLSSCTERSKRALIIYHHHRINQLRRIFWLSRNSIADIRKESPKVESRFLRNYSENAIRYINKYSLLDLRSDLQPPKDLFIQVRVVRDCGQIQTESGPVSLKANTFHFIRESDVQHLVSQGYLEHLV